MLLLIKSFFNFSIFFFYYFIIKKNVKIWTDYTTTSTTTSTTRTTSYYDPDDWKRTQLEEIGLPFIEKYLREKKLQNIKKLTK